MTIKLENVEPEQAEESVYLGSVITQDGKSARKTAIVNKLCRIWKSHNIFNRVKVRLYETFVVSVLVYELEC